MSLIAQLRGTVVEKTYERVIIDVAGVGYGVVVSVQTLAELPEVGAPAIVRTYHHVREDAHVLYGFSRDEERRAFELLIGVSGIGPKLAMSILSALRPEALVDAVGAGDVARLVKTPGIGKKTAERLVVELKDKVEKIGVLRAPGAAEIRGVRPVGAAGTIVSALVNLGYRQIEAERAAAEAIKGREGAPLEVVIKEALRTLTA